MDVLIGNDNYYKIVEGKRPGGLQAVPSKLGWVLHGQEENRPTNSPCATVLTNVYSNELQTDHEFDITEFWNLNHMGIRNHEQADERPLRKISETLKRLPDGRLQVTIP